MSEPGKREPFGSARQTFLATLHRMLWSRYGVTSYAQHGEDIVLAHYLQNPSERAGFYVDVGAHHPRRFSVTHLYSHDWGWRGINIDPNPELMELFRKQRPRDISVTAAASQTDGESNYYMFDEPAINTLSAEQAEALKAGGRARLLKTLPVRSRPLHDILRDHLPAGQAIDFMNVDAEQLDLEVLRSNDWSRYRPAIVLVEDLESNLGKLNESAIVGYMGGQGYEPVGYLCKTVFLRDIQANRG